jgi:hypothetical protein
MGASDDGPIVLTNQDVDRLAENDREQHGAGQLIRTPTAREAEKSEARRSAAQDTRDEATPRPAQSYNERAGSWQEEYYRLKAIALKRALERGEPIHFGDEAPPEPSSVATAKRSNDAGSSCVYRASGELLHAPDGIECRPHRSAPASPSGSAAESARAAGPGHSTCLYGTRGQVLYAPAGRTCD